MKQSQKDQITNFVNTGLFTITLDGKEAVIRGKQYQYPTICKVGNASGYQFDWETIANIIDNHNGAFQSSKGYFGPEKEAETHFSQS